MCHPGRAGAHRRHKARWKLSSTRGPTAKAAGGIKEILENRGVAFKEHICADGKLDGNDLRNLDIDVKDFPLTVIDGGPIAGLQQAQIEQAIGWIGF